MYRGQTTESRSSFTDPGFASGVGPVLTGTRDRRLPVDSTRADPSPADFRYVHEPEESMVPQLGFPRSRAPPFRVPTQEIESGGCRPRLPLVDEPEIVDEAEESRC